MLKSPFKLLSFSRRAKTPNPNPNPRNDEKPKGKLRKVRRSKTADTPMQREVVDTSTPFSGGKHPPGEHYQMQPTGLLFSGQENDYNTHAFPPHTQAGETIQDPSQNFPEGGEKGDPNRSRSSTLSVRKDSFGGGGGNSLTHDWDDNPRGVQDWVDSGAPYIPKHQVAPEFPSSNVGPHRRDVQEHHDAENKKESQQRNNGLHQPIEPQASPLIEGENRAGREGVSKHNHERNEAAGHGRSGDRVEDSSKPDIYYYIVPTDLDIIFQDEDGTEITRVGKTIKGTQDHPPHTETKNIPIVVQDIFGNELFRSPLPRQLISPNHTPWKTIIVDEKGSQIPLKYAATNVGGSTSSLPA